MLKEEGNIALATRRFDQAELVKDLRKQVTALEDDLRVRSDEVEEFATALRREYDDAFEAKRTAATYGAWRDERVTQIAAAWALGTVFVRFCEDNQLIEWPFIAGPRERLADAEERHEAFFREHPRLNDRDWIVAAFDHLASTHPTVAGLFDKRYNPLWEITPSFEAATALLGFWRRRGDNGEIRYDFTDTWDTRFLGDLYQDLSEHARKTYALLQTPEFVEEFILDLTLEPAVEEFGLKGLRTIDPTCGSGHFLLGIFRRLLDKWREAEPGTDDWELIKRSMESIHGCDKNPFAASIARFRLLIAALRGAEEILLARAPVFPINVAVGDSLLHGRGAPGIQIDLFESSSAHTYRTEDVGEYVQRCDLLGISSYHVVVGNPPYITVKDKQENENYRGGYTACARSYALSIPFAQRLFHLAIRMHGAERAAGFVGQITANSFMKREFGKKLIEDFFPSICLTHVIDTSGAYIPGHGTPTVIVVGRNRLGRADETVRAVLGVRGEPAQPQNAPEGLVWSAIINQVADPGSESDWVSVADIKIASLWKFPWSLSGGGVNELANSIATGRRRLKARSESIGRTTKSGADDVYLVPDLSTARRYGDERVVRELVTGEVVRDFSLVAAVWVRNPYVDRKNSLAVPPECGLVARNLWPFRAILANRIIFGRKVIESGRPWYSHLESYPSKLNTPYGICFAFVATHNHFVLDRHSRLFGSTAPVIKLPEAASEDDHFALLGVLNSSTACLWLKQVSHNKGRPGAEQAGADEPWEHRYEFAATKLQEFPLPDELPLALGCNLDQLARQLVKLEPATVCEGAIPTRDSLDQARGKHERVRGRMIALQEELDWQVYLSYGLLAAADGAQLTADGAQLTADEAHSVPEIGPSERPFALILARQVAAGESTTTWFTHHNHKFKPVTEIPNHWPQWYRDIVKVRIELIEKRLDIALIERPEYKRRWATQPWEKKEAEALRTWLLDRCENPDLWFALRDGMKQPRTLTVSQLADKFRDDADMQSVAQLYATDHMGKRDLTLAQVLESVVADQHVPYLAALRYKDSGLRKRQQWEQVWDLQREEDRTGERLDIPVPPKYASGDFRKTSYWSQRGKLDVPKERFISYPDANPDSDPTLLLGWAGWDHKDQAQALVNVVNDRTEQAGWDTEKIKPLLAGLLELMPWVRQWYGDYDAEWEGTPSEEYQAYLEEQRAKHQLTEDDLRGWRPASATRGRTATKG